jgi:hypothetical protein
MNALWRGSRSLTEAPNSPDVDYQNDRYIASREYYGPYAVCVASRPAGGQRMGDLAGEYRVTFSKITRLAGGKGRLSVTAEWIDPPGENFPPSPQTLEIDWVREDVALESHPHFSSDGVCDKKLVRQYFDDANEENRNQVYARMTEETDTAGAGQGSDQEIVRMKLRGVQSYMRYAPLISRTTEVRRPILNVTCGLVYTSAAVRQAVGTPVPSTSADAESYIYIKTADKSTRTGKKGRWVRAEQWMGFTGVERHIYKTPDGEWY